MHYENLNALHLTEESLQTELSKAGYGFASEVLIVMPNITGKLHISPLHKSTANARVYH